MISLALAARTLDKRFGARMAEPYVPGKTMFRDALCEEHGLSMSDAEVLCDSLEQAKAIRFMRSEVDGPVWIVDVGAAPAPR